MKFIAYTVRIAILDTATEAQLEHLGNALRDAVFYSNAIDESKQIVVERLATYTPKPKVTP